jgi:hypothetical protein
MVCVEFDIKMQLENSKIVGRFLTKMHNLTLEQQVFYIKKLSEMYPYEFDDVMK